MFAFLQSDGITCARMAYEFTVVTDDDLSVYSQFVHFGGKIVYAIGGNFEVAGVAVCSFVFDIRFEFKIFDNLRCTPMRFIEVFYKIEVSLGTSQLDTGLGAFFGSRHELFVNYFDRAYRT